MAVTIENEKTQQIAGFRFLRVADFNPPEANPSVHFWVLSEAADFAARGVQNCNFTVTFGR